MSTEVRSQILYSPEGILNLNVGLNEGYDIGEKYRDLEEKHLQRKREYVESLAEDEGINVSENDNIINLDIDIEKRFHGSFNNGGDEDINNFLTKINVILPYHPTDNVDRVFGIDEVYNIGARGVVYEHFQRWFNAKGLTEEAAKHSVSAMAQPFGKDIVQENVKSFTYSANKKWQAARGHDSYVQIAEEEFGLISFERTDNNHTEKNGQVAWGNLSIATLGDCACWGVLGDDRSRLILKENTKRLYELDPHNIDFARQSLSLILGVGALAYHAAQYKGHEDIFDEVEWSEPGIYPLLKD